MPAGIEASQVAAAPGLDLVDDVDDVGAGLLEDDEEDAALAVPAQAAFFMFFDAVTADADVAGSAPARRCDRRRSCRSRRRVESSWSLA